MSGACNNAPDEGGARHAGLPADNETAIRLGSGGGEGEAHSSSPGRLDAIYQRPGRWAVRKTRLSRARAGVGRQL